MRKINKSIVALMLATALVAGEARSSDDPVSVESISERVPLAEIRRFVSVFNAVRSAHAEEVPLDRLMQGAIKGLLLDLDPHSVYLTAEQSRAFSEKASGRYEGIGVEVMVQEDQTLRVISPIEGGPAALAGLKAGDVIISVDGKSLSSLHGQEPLRGPAGSEVTIEVTRSGFQRPMTLRLQRQAIHLSSVRSQWVSPGYAQIRISNFQADTLRDFKSHIEKLEQSGPLSGVVLDLRANPGGLLGAAVEVADLLIDEGVIVSTKGRLAASDTQFDASQGALLTGVPMVVLVDAGSASASEVLAAALRDNNRACVVGSRTFGKGSVQTVLPLDNGDSVKLTTARYYTPAGRSIQGVGIVPDLWLHPMPGTTDAAAGMVASESSLEGHLVGEEETGTATTAGPGEILEGERILEQAVDYLKQLKQESCQQPEAP